MPQLPSDRRAFLLKGLAATATAGAGVTLATSAGAEPLICLKKIRRHCLKWGKAPLPPKPDPKDIKRK